MKKNKKLLIIALLVVIILAIVIFFLVKPNNNENVNNNNPNGTTQEPESDGSIGTTNIQSTKDNKLEVDNVEAKNIEIKHYTNEIKVTTTLKNNTGEEVDGFFIHIGLLDKSGNQITSIAENSTEIIPVNGEVTITNYVSELENSQNITNAKILSLEKTNIKDSLENTFEEMEDSIPIPDEEE